MQSYLVLLVILMSSALPQGVTVTVTQFNQTITVSAIETVAITQTVISTVANMTITQSSVTPVANITITVTNSTMSAP